MIFRALPLLVLACVAIPAAATTEMAVPEDQTQQAAPFDGTWQGTIQFDKEAFLVEGSTPSVGEPMRIEISGPVVRVFLKIGANLEELHPGSFHIAAVNTNAVIFGTTEAPGAWVETSVFAVTQKDADTLIVEYSRVVNNVGTPLSDPTSKFATRGFGEFARVKP